MDEQTFPSTTYEWRRVKMSRPAGGQTGSRPKGGRWWFLSRYDWRKPLALTVKYRGGAEGWFEVHSRGGIGRFPGHACIYDVMREITRQDVP